MLPGFGVSQAMHAVLATSFLVMHASHSHEVVACFAARLLNKSSAGFMVAAGIPNEKLGAGAAVTLLPGFAVSQQAHLSLLASFLVKHSSQSHEVVFCFAARLLNKSSEAGAAGAGTERDFETNALSLPFLEVLQHKHAVFVESLRVRHESHSHEADFC